MMNMAMILRLAITYTRLIIMKLQILSDVHLTHHGELPRLQRGILKSKL